VIVGGGNSAGQAAIHLAGHGHHITVVIRGDDLSASMSQYLIDRIGDHAEIEVLPHSAVEQLDGTLRLEQVVVKDIVTGTHRTLTASALFVLIGAEPHTQWLGSSVGLDRAGFILTGSALGPQTEHQSRGGAMNRSAYLLETSLPGVFAAGDVRSGSVKRVASAVGEGSIAARFASEHLGRRSALDPGGSPAH
jgi:thioredoxin reductase (NADPH)